MILLVGGRGRNGTAGVLTRCSHVGLGHAARGRLDLGHVMRLVA